jgi:hypothetical protein
MMKIIPRMLISMAADFCERDAEQLPLLVISLRNWKTLIAAQNISRIRSLENKAPRCGASKQRVVPRNRIALA